MQDMVCQCCSNKMEIIIDPKVFSCTQCGHVFRNFIINEKEYYQKYREISKPHENSKRLFFAQNLINLIGKYLRPHDSVLELGSGDGVFAKFLSKKVKNVFCCELDSNLANVTKQMGFITYNDHLLELNDSLRFDTVVAIDVLEHIKDLRVFVDKFYDLANRIIIQVPVSRAIHQNEPFDGHYHYFTQNSISMLFQDKFNLVHLIEQTKRNSVANGPEMVAIFDKKES